MVNNSVENTGHSFFSSPLKITNYLSLFCCFAQSNYFKPYYVSNFLGDVTAAVVDDDDALPLTSLSSSNLLTL